MNADAPVPTTLETAWPLFGLRIRSEHLILRLPTDDDILALIDVAKAGIHPPDEMPFGVAWSVEPSPAFERGFVQHHWGMRASWTPVVPDGASGDLRCHAEAFCTLVSTAAGLPPAGIAQLAR